MSKRDYLEGLVFMVIFSAFALGLMWVATLITGPMYR